MSGFYLFYITLNKGEPYCEVLSERPYDAEFWNPSESCTSSMFWLGAEGYPQEDRT